MISSILLTLICSASFTRVQLPAQSNGVRRTAQMPQIPSPSGPFGIGRMGFDWTDPSRNDDYDSKRQRELMVYFWYPTAKSPDAKGQYYPGAAQMDAKPEIRKIMSDEFGEAWTAMVSSEISSHAIEHAPIANSRRTFPIVIFSHGVGGSGFEYTVLIENLVSNGYVVASIEHTYTAGAVWFPDGRVIVQRDVRPPVGLSPSERMQWMMTRLSTGINESAADIRFVLDRLTQVNHDQQQLPLAGAIDLTRVAAMGHSGGAEFAARACQQDPRIKACVDLDGAMVPVAALPVFDVDRTMRQPLLFLEANHSARKMGGPPDQMANYEKVKQQQLQALRPGSYYVVLHSPEIAHPGFSDVPLLFHGQDGYPAPPIALHNLGLITEFVRAFLNKTLLGEKEPLFDGRLSPLSEAEVSAYGH